MKMLISKLFTFLASLPVAMATKHPSFRGAQLFQQGEVTTSDATQSMCNLGYDICNVEDKGDGGYRDYIGDSVIVLGHLSPDTDAVGAAIVRAWELRVASNNGRDPICARAAINTDAINRETIFVLDYFGIDTPDTESVADGKHYAVVDTNNLEELTRDYSPQHAKLHSIVDHHRIAGTIKTDEPIEFDNRPIASTGSVLYQRAKSSGLDVPGKGCEVNIAGLMLSTILSDTLVFRSPTTTTLDIEAAGELGELAGIDDVTAYGEMMLDAKSDITGYSAMDLVLIDSKVADLINGDEEKFKVRVSVFETVRPEYVLDIDDDISTACDVQLRNDQKDDATFRAVLFFIIDIIKEMAIYIPAETNTFGTDLVLNSFPDARVLDDGNIELPGVLSRKKTIMPALSSGALITEYDGSAPDSVECMEYPEKIKCPQWEIYLS